MRRSIWTVLCGVFLGGLLFVGQGCCGNHPHLACPWDYSGHNLLHSASASCDDVVTDSYVQRALRCSCHNAHGDCCECQHRCGVDGGDCRCNRVDEFDQRCRCDWKAPYCLCGYYE